LNQSPLLMYVDKIVADNLAKKSFDRETKLVAW
jgi:hypothetical protein